MLQFLWLITVISIHKYFKVNKKSYIVYLKVLWTEQILLHKLNHDVV